MKCKIYIKGHKCDSCKVSKQYNRSINCFKNRKCDVYAICKKYCQYIIKIYCANYTERREKCVNCKDLPLKCINNGNYFNLINKYFTNLLSYNAVLSNDFRFSPILRLKNARFKSLFNSQPMENVI